MDRCWPVILLLLPPLILGGRRECRVITAGQEGGAWVFLGAHANLTLTRDFHYLLEPLRPSDLRWHKSPLPPITLNEGWAWLADPASTRVRASSLHHRDDEGCEVLITAVGRPPFESVRVTWRFEAYASMPFLRLSGQIVSEGEGRGGAPAMMTRVGMWEARVSAANQPLPVVTLLHVDQWSWLYGDNGFTVHQAPVGRVDSPPLGEGSRCKAIHTWRLKHA
jgi:hypothetical protein